jgi:hypothetical protein
MQEEIHLLINDIIFVCGVKLGDFFSIVSLKAGIG